MLVWERERSVREQAQREVLALQVAFSLLCVSKANGVCSVNKEKAGQPESQTE